MRLAGLVRETLVGREAPELAADVDREMDSAVGRYRYVRIQGVQYRVYYEEAGQAYSPAICTTTASSTTSTGARRAASTRPGSARTF